MTHPTASPAADDSNRLAMRLFAAVLLAVVLVVAAVLLFGMPALGIIGVVATVLMFVVLLGITAGN